MSDDLAPTAERETLDAEIERLELAEAGTQTLQRERARVAQVLHIK